MKQMERDSDAMQCTTTALPRARWARMAALVARKKGLASPGHLCASPSFGSGVRGRGAEEGT